MQRIAIICVTLASMVLLASSTRSSLANGAAVRRSHETYALLYVTSDPPGASVTSTNDGQTLDDGSGTPSQTLFRRSHFPYGDQPIGLLIYATCFKPAFKRVNINRWYGTIVDAQSNPNVVRVALDRLTNCTP
jgi:hypothetical protein